MPAPTAAPAPARRHTRGVRRELGLIAVVVLVTGCASRAQSSPPRAHVSRAVASAAATMPQAHPQAIEPVAGAASSDAAPAPQAAAPVSVGQSSGGLAQPQSDTQIRQELAASGLSASPNQATLTPDGLAIAPINAPPAVQQIIAAGNQIAHLPYVWGGGHVTYEDTGYDCSGSISFVFGAAHLLTGSVVSGGLMSYGLPGPGKWVTVFANQGHTFMYVAGLRFDTVALAETGSRWSARSADESNLSSFSVRHPPGL